MRVCIINPYYDAAPETPLEVTGRYRHVEGLANALARRGHEITVIQTLDKDKTETCNDVRFRYVRTPWLSAYSLSGGSFGIGLLFQGRFDGLVQALLETRPDAVHVNGITLLTPLDAVSKWCSQNAVPITVSHHGGTPGRLPWLRAALRLVLGNCRAFFTTESHAKSWIQSGVLTSSASERMTSNLPSRASRSNCCNPDRSIVVPEIAESL